MQTETVATAGTRRKGTALPQDTDGFPTVPDRVAKRAATKYVRVVGSDCLVSTYSLGGDGYPQIGWSDDGVRGITHAPRAAWIYWRGPIPHKLTVDHKCRIRQCVNIRHLRLLSRGQNSQRANLGTDWPVDECFRGHKSETAICRACVLEVELLYDGGMTYRAIAQKLGVDVTTVERWRKACRRPTELR